MLCPSCRAENDDDARLCVACRTPLRVISAGSVVGGRYEIRQTLGRGGMGTVYRAHDRVLDETVALKILRADVAGTPGMAARFRSEIKLARRVSHTNVCRIYEYGEDAGLQYISMELVEGSNLKDQLTREGPPGLERAFELAIQIGDGLEAVHKAGIVHRDVKTQNIMVDAQGIVRVMDFGIARAAAPGRPADAATGYVLGSPEYMSPEQARGLPADFRSDVYSLGVVVFEIFSGRVPFRADTPVATLLMHLENRPPLEGPDAPPLPPALVPVLTRALAKEPGARYSGAREAAAALRDARVSSVPGRPSTPRRAEAASARPRPRMAAWVVLATVLAAAAALAMWRSQHAGSHPTPAPSLVAEPPAQVTLPAAPAPVPSPTAVAPHPTSVRATRAPRPSPTGAAPTEAAPPPDTSPAVPSPPTPVATATPHPAQPSPGALLVVARPWADVSIDGVVVGQTPLQRLTLSPGPHDILLTHPEFQPFKRRVTIRAGETFRLAVDLATEGVRRR